MNPQVALLSGLELAAGIWTMGSIDRLSNEVI